MNGVCCSVGGGAIGSAVAAMLVGALGGRAWLLTRPSAHAEAIQRQRGLWVTYPSGARKLCPVDVAFDAVGRRDGEAAKAALKQDFEGVLPPIIRLLSEQDRAS